MNIDELKQISIKNLKGIGDKNGSLFARLGIESIYDLLFYFPRDYKQLPKPVQSFELIEGQKCAVKLTVGNDLFYKQTASNAVTTVTGFDSTGEVSLAFFRVSYIKTILKRGSEWIFLGTVKRKGRKYAMEMPEIFKVSDYMTSLDSLLPVYPLTKGINSKTILKYVNNAYDLYDCFEDNLSDDIISDLNLCSLKSAIKGIHCPKNFDMLKTSRDRLAFDEFYSFFKGLKETNEEFNDKPSAYKFIETAEYKRFLEVLPYELTNGQKKTNSEILNDLTSGYVMNRLIQGDVGSGKTIVAFLACLLCTSNGYQAAFMAPTEVLAAQHYKNFTSFIERYGLDIRVVFVSGSLSASEKRKISDKLARNEYNLAVGTHALFQESVEFSDLALVVTDEQHRFGVLQREALAEKGINPHVLSMSATPIPRTLAESYYTGLKVSVISDKPSDRIPIKTGIRLSKDRLDGLRFMYKEISNKRQGIVVCPMIEENEELELSNVTEYSKYLKELMPKEIRIGVLHGKMKNAEKNRIMEYFANGMIDILVSTQVIEVGIDVPNATVILIENAERFGLATLHQLRGRVGRGSYPSYCILINGSSSESDNERLNVLCNSSDGFYIADEDLRLRGPGDILGVRQSGEFAFKIGDLYRDRDLFVKAKEYVYKE